MPSCLIDLGDELEGPLYLAAARWPSVRNAIAAHRDKLLGGM